MNKDSKFIFENYRKVISEQSTVPNTGVPELDDIIKYVNSKAISDYSKQLIFNALNNKLITASFSNQAQEPNDADTVNLSQGAVSEPGSPSATGQPQNPKPSASPAPFRFEF